MNAAGDAVTTTNLTKRFGDRTVVQTVNLHVPTGTAFGYLGPNGAGKTTLIRMLLGLTPASSGSMHILGLPVPEQRAAALARVGAIVEEPRFHDHLSGRENLEVVAAARGGPAATRIDHCIDRMGLHERAHDRVKTYSLGMRQRLGIARCLLADPDILILDEPMNGLDPAGIAEFRTFVHDFIDQGRTVVLSSHLLDEIEKTCTNAAIVDQGQVVAQGSINDLRKNGEPRLRVDVDQPELARQLLQEHPAVKAIHASGGPGELELTITDITLVSELNRTLIEGGCAVQRFEPTRATLEERFLEITHRLETKP
jgi:ABC-2 type transport system ATP-binding protein